MPDHNTLEGMHGQVLTHVGDLVKTLDRDVAAFDLAASLLLVHD